MCSLELSDHCMSEGTSFHKSDHGLSESDTVFATDFNTI